LWFQIYGEAAAILSKQRDGRDQTVFTTQEQHNQCGVPKHVERGQPTLIANGGGLILFFGDSTAGRRAWKSRFWMLDLSAHNAPV